MYRPAETVSTIIQGTHCCTHFRASIHKPTTESAVVNESHQGTVLGV